MAFDLATAKPASGGGFDLASAKPVAEPAKTSSPENDGFLANTEAFARGAGTGFGRLVLGGQRIVGKGLEAVSSAGTPGAKAAQWLVNDADTGRARLGAELEPYQVTNPISTTTGKVAGEILGTLPVGGGALGLARSSGVAAPVGAVLGAGGRAVQAAAAGAGVGAVLGAANSQADTIGGIGVDAASGAATSAILSGALSPVAGAIGAVAGNVKNRLSNTSAAQYAKQKIAEAIARDARGASAAGGATSPLDQVSARFRKLGEEATVADAGGRNTNQLLDTLATLPGRTKDAAYNLLRDRTAGVGNRLRNAAENSLDTQGQRLDTTIESLIARRRADSGPLYNQLRQIDVQPSASLTDTVKAADKLGAIQLGREIATAKQQPFTIDAAQPAKWNMGDLDHVKQGIDQLLSSRKALNADGSLTPLGNAYQNLKSSLVGELDGVTVNPQTGISLYAQARKAFENPSKMIDAANMGKAAINRDETSILSAVKGMSDSELQAFRIGAFEGLRGKLGTQAGQTQILNMWKNPGMQEKLRAMFGSERAYREFAATAAVEARLKALQSVGTGSQTAARQAGMGDLDASALSDAGAIVTGAKSGNLLMAAGAAKNAWNRVATPQTVRDQMGQFLLSQGQTGQQNLNSLAGLVEQINARNILLGNGVGQIGGQAGNSLIAIPAKRPNNN